MIYNDVLFYNWKNTFKVNLKWQVPLVAKKKFEWLNRAIIKKIIAHNFIYSIYKHRMCLLYLRH